MRIESAVITGVGDGKSQSLHLTPGTNILLGRNGSGKTASIWALRQVFEPQINQRYPIGPDAAITVTLERDGRRWAWKRNLHSGSLQISDGSNVMFDGIPQEGDPQYTELVDTFFGPGNLEQWLSNSIVSDTHAQNGGPRSNGALVEEKAVDLLAEEMKRLVSRSEAEPGELDILGDEIEVKATRLQSWEEDAATIEQNIEKQVKLEAALREAESSAEARREVLETLERFQELTQESESLTQKTEQLEQERATVKKHVEAVEHAEKSLEEEYGHFLNAGTDLEDALQEWTEATSRHHDLQRRLHLARQAVSVAPQTHTQRNGILAGSGLAVLSFFAFMGAGAMVPGAIVAPIVGVLGYGVVWGKDRSLQSMLETRRREIIELEAENEEVEKILETTKQSMGKLGNLGHPMAIRRSVIQYWRAREEVEELRAKRDKHASLHELTNQHEEYLHRLSELEKEMGSLVEGAKFISGIASNKATLAGEVDMARAQNEASQSRVQRLHDEMAKLVEETQGLVGDVKSLGRLEREYNELAYRMHSLKDEYDALQLAHQVLNESVIDYRGSHQKRIADRAAELLAEFTDGDYKAVRFAEGSQPEALHADGSWRSPSAMSHGRSEQLHLAVRLAEAEQASEPWPLVLDEPFLRWDPECRKRAQAELKRINGLGGQVLLLSQDPSFGSWGSVIELDSQDGSQAQAA